VQCGEIQVRNLVIFKASLLMRREKLGEALTCYFWNALLLSSRAERISNLIILEF
jgi:hypothetical protein